MNKAAPYSFLDQTLLFLVDKHFLLKKGEMSLEKIFVFNIYFCLVISFVYGFYSFSDGSQCG